MTLLDGAVDLTATAVVLTGLLLATLMGHPVVQLVFRLVDAGTAPEPAEESEPLRAAASALRGGLWIGLLERAAVFVALLLGSTEVLALVVALKGLGRYPELRSAESPAVAERFIIGTLASLLWAAACAGGVVRLLSL